MKTRQFFGMALMMIVLPMGIGAYAQQTLQLNQVVVASGGAFSDPDDYVTVSSLNPVTLVQQNFATIYTQAVQDILVDGLDLFVAATDSLMMYNLDTYERLDAIALSGLSQLYTAGDYVFVSIQYPETSGFLRVFKRNSLVMLSEVEGITDESAGMVAFADKLYVAVPGSWTSTRGKLAVVDLNSHQLIEEIDLGELSTGIHSLFVYENNVIAVCRTPWGAEQGVITVYNTEDKTVAHNVFDNVFGTGIAVFRNTLYLFVDNGIGAIDLLTFEMLDPAVIEDPGSASFIYFADAAFDHLNQQFFATTSDYFSFGQGHVFGQEGVETGLFEAGISPEAIGLDYRDVTGIEQSKQVYSLILSPNPASNMIRFETGRKIGPFDAIVYSLHGQLMQKHQGYSDAIDISSLPNGYYILTISTPEGMTSMASFVKLSQANER